MRITPIKLWKDNKLYKYLFIASLVLFPISLIFPSVFISNSVKERSQFIKINRIKSNFNSVIQYFSENNVNNKFYNELYVPFFLRLFPSKVFDFNNFNTAVSFYNNFENQEKIKFNNLIKELNYEDINIGIDDDNIIKNNRKFVDNLKDLDFSIKCNKLLFLFCIMLFIVSFLLLFFIIYSILGYKLSIFSWIFAIAFIFIMPLLCFI